MKERGCRLWWGGGERAGLGEDVFPGSCPGWMQLYPLCVPCAQPEAGFRAADISESWRVSDTVARCCYR